MLETSGHQIAFGSFRYLVLLNLAFSRCSISFSFNSSISAWTVVQRSAFIQKMQLFLFTTAFGGPPLFSVSAETTPSFLPLHQAQNLFLYCILMLRAPLIQISCWAFLILSLLQSRVGVCVLFLVFVWWVERQRAERGLRRGGWGVTVSVSAVVWWRSGERQKGNKKHLCVNNANSYSIHAEMCHNEARLIWSVHFLH